MDLVSERLNVDDYDAAVELFYERRWTDGLPIMLPTRARHDRPSQVTDDSQRSHDCPSQATHGLRWTKRSDTKETR